MTREETPHGRILIVEDDAASGHVLRALLRQVG